MIGAALGHVLDIYHSGNEERKIPSTEYRLTSYLRLSKFRLERLVAGTGMISNPLLHPTGIQKGVGVRGHSAFKRTF